MIKTKGYILPFFALCGIALGIRTVIVSSYPPPKPEILVEPQKSPYRTYVAGAGVVEASSENISVAPEISGVISEVNVVVGSKVKVGDPLFVLDQRRQLAELELREASMKVAKARLRDAENQLSFLTAVKDSGAVSAELRARRKDQVAISRAELEEAIALSKQSKTLLDLHTVRSPIDGEVLQLRARPGEFAQAQASSSSLIIIGDTSNLHVRADFDENDAWRIKPGNSATAYVRGNNSIKADLEFLRIERLIIPKRSLTGDSSERVDTRVLQVVFRVKPGSNSLMVGQLLDVYLDAD